MCDCDLCKYSRKVRDIIARRDVEELIKLVEELHNINYNMGFDLDIANATLNGTWDSSVEQLEKALELAKKIRLERS